MSAIIRVAWANSRQTAILVTYTTVGWTWADVKASTKQTYDLMETVPHLVDIVVDVQKSNWLPRGGSLVGLAKHMSSNRHPRQRYTVIVGSRGFWAELVNGLWKLSRGYPRDVHFADTMGDAIRLLEKQVAQPARR
jgi:hypothetical protein